MGIKRGEIYLDKIFLALNRHSFSVRLNPALQYHRSTHKSFFFLIIPSISK